MSHLDIVGSGAIGTARARRLGVGRQVILADSSPDRSSRARDDLTTAGHAVTALIVDITSASSVLNLAEIVARAGELDVIVLTAGIAPQQGTSQQILRVDLYGVALVIYGFLPLARRGTAMTVFSSGGAYSETFSKGTERMIATTPTEMLLNLEVIDLESPDTRRSYHLAKRALQARVQVEALRWCVRGARINTVSPGVIATPMTVSEMQSFNEETRVKARAH